MKNSFLGWYVLFVMLVREVFVLLWLLYSRPSTNIFSSPYNISIPLSPPLSKLGWQSCWVACLLVCLWLCYRHTHAGRKSLHLYFRFVLYFVLYVIASSKAENIDYTKIYCVHAFSRWQKVFVMCKKCKILGRPQTSRFMAVFPC
jgi:hypothetical protein